MIAFSHIPKKTAALVAAFLCLIIRGHAQGANETIERTLAALHVQDIHSIRIEGRGFDALFGQAYDGDSQWPLFALTRFSLFIDYQVNSMRDERIRSQLQNPPLGGGNQPIPEQHQTLFYRDNQAWNLNLRGEPVSAQEERDLRSPIETRQTQIYLTPVGFLKAALVHNAQQRQVPVGDVRKTLITFEVEDHRRFEGTINSDFHLERIRTWVGTPVLGDVVLDADFSDYQDFGGISYPRHIVQSEGGYPLLDVTLTSVNVNGSTAVSVPQNQRPRETGNKRSIESQLYGDGIWIIPGADYHASKTIVVEFKDYVVAIEAPDSEERSIEVIDQIHKLTRKPIRYIVNTHTHFDHSGGLRTYAAEGATVVTWEGNVPYYRQVWSNAHTIHPDRLALSKKQAVFEGVVGNRVFSDGDQEIVVFHYAGNFHSPGMLGIYLPKQRAVIEADSFNPQLNPQDPPTAIPNLVQFYQAVDRLGLTVDHVIPIHGRITSFAEGRKVIAEYKRSQLWQ